MIRHKEIKDRTNKAVEPSGLNGGSFAKPGSIAQDAVLQPHPGRWLTSAFGEFMTKPTRAILLWIQVIMAFVSAIPWALITYLSLLFSPVTAAIAVMHGTAALLLIRTWIIDARSGRSSAMTTAGSIFLWLIPAAIAGFYTACSVHEMIYPRPEDIEYYKDGYFESVPLVRRYAVPTTFIYVPILFATWFSVPLVLSILCAKSRDVSRVLAQTQYRWDPDW